MRYWSYIFTLYNALNKIHKRLKLLLVNTGPILVLSDSTPSCFLLQSRPIQIISLFMLPAKEKVQVRNIVIVLSMIIFYPHFGSKFCPHSQRKICSIRPCFLNLRSDIPNHGLKYCTDLQDLCRINIVICQMYKFSFLSIISYLIPWKTELMFGIGWLTYGNFCYVLDKFFSILPIKKI